MRKFICFILGAILMLGIIMPVNVSADEMKSETVRVGWYEDSYHISGENGERSGYAYEYEQAVSAYTGWRYAYVKGDWGELLEKLQNGEIDMMAAISYTDERAETMLFSELPMGNEKYYLYADLDNTDISASDLSTLNGKRIAVMEQSVQATQFAEWEAQHNISTQHIDVDSFEKAVVMAENHEIDGVISTETPAWVEAGMAAIVTTGGSDIYYAVSRERPDIKEKLDAAMRAMENDKPFYSDELYERYLMSQSVSVLSQDEKSWLNEHGKIKLGYLKNDPGISMYDTSTGKVTGVINDYIKYAEDCFENQNINFKLVGFDTESELMYALQDGEIDMIFNASQNPYFAERYGFALSNTVLSFSVAAVTSQDYFDESAQNVVAIEKNNSEAKWYISYNYPKWNIVECDSYDDAKKMVKSGEADCLVVRTAETIEYINDRELHSTFLTRPWNMSFAICKGNTALLSILNKTLKTIQTSKLSGAVTMYEDSMKKVTVTDFVKDNLPIVASVFFIVFIIVLSVVLGLLRRAKIAEEKAKNASAAKSLFLFNMSHDIRTPMNALLGYNRLMKKDLTDPKLLEYQGKIEQSGNLLLSIINNVLDMAQIESGKVDIDESYSKTGNILREVCDVFEVEAAKKDITLNYELNVEHRHIMCDSTKIREVFTNLISNAIKYTEPGGRVDVKVQEIPCKKSGYVRYKAEVIDNGIGMSEDYLPSLFAPFTRERNTTTGRVAGTGLGMPIVKRLVDLMGGSIEVQSKLGKGTTFTVILEHRIADESYYVDEKNKISIEEDKKVIRGKHILLAEDNDLNAEIAEVILTDMGLVVDRVEDGAKCIARLKEMPAGTYDMILMDIQMPNMDGYEATQEIRNLSDSKKAKIPIFAMTANAFEEDKKIAISKGMNGHISKPIEAEKILEVIVLGLKNKLQEK